MHAHEPEALSQPPIPLYRLLLSRQGRIRLLGLDLPDYSSRITSHAVERGHIFCHNAPRTDGNAPPYGHSREHHNATSEPAVLADGNGLAEFRAVDTIAEEWIERMCGGIKRTTWTDEGTSADGDQAGIEKGTAEVDIDALAKPEMVSIRSVCTRDSVGVPEVGSIIDVDGTVNIRLFLEEGGILFLCCAWRGERTLVINNAENHKLERRGCGRRSMDWDIAGLV
jgi:hypothetical protein